MEVQSVIVTIIFILAALYVGKLLVGKIKSFSTKNKNCGDDCGCASKTNKIHAQIRRN